MNMSVCACTQQSDPVLANGIRLIISECIGSLLIMYNISPAHTMHRYMYIHMRYRNKKRGVCGIPNVPSIW